MKLIATLWFAVLFAGCGIRGYHWAGGTGDVTHAIEPGARVVIPNNLKDPPPASVQPVCDETLWKHVYHPKRLKVIKDCTTVTGTIVDATHGKRKDGQRHEADADNHGWLKIDDTKEQADILIPGNAEAEDGNLVFECVCQYLPVKQQDAKAACKDFRSAVVIPPIGSRVAITGPLVEDLQHKPIHREIHPVTRIVVLTEKKE